MYDELVKRLREAAKYDPEYVPCIIHREDAIEAADAIEELSKAQEQRIEQELNALLKQRDELIQTLHILSMMPVPEPPKGENNGDK